MSVCLKKHLWNTCKCHSYHSWW